MNNNYESYVNGAPSMYQITKEIYESKERYELLIELNEWLSSYKSLEIPYYEIKNKIDELLKK